LFAGLAMARGDGRYVWIMRALNGVQLLILDGARVCGRSVSPRAASRQTFSARQ
jgi:hypothetical protein